MHALLCLAAPVACNTSACCMHWLRIKLRSGNASIPQSDIEMMEAENDDDDVDMTFNPVILKQALR